MTLWPEDVMWKVSAAWLGKAHDCTPTGIADRCGAGCCYNKGTGQYWPARAEGAPIGAPCKNLTPTGCRFGPDERPVTCLLYPLRVVGDTVRLHWITVMPTSVCRGNHGQGPLVIDAMRDSLVALWGEDEYARVRTEVLAGRDTWVRVPPHIVAALEAERDMEARDVVPGPR